MIPIKRLLNVALVVSLIALVFVGVAYAQGETDTPDDLVKLFGAVLAAALAVERILQTIRRIVHPQEDEDGPFARGSKALTYYTTIGGVLLGLLFAFAGNLRMLEIAGIQIDATLDTVVTGVTVGMGSEFVHEVIKVVGETKGFLRARS